mgnify:FL=1
MINQHKIENVLHAVYIALDKISLGDLSKDKVLKDVANTLRTLRKVEILEELRKEGDSTIWDQEQPKNKLKSFSLTLL